MIGNVWEWTADAFHPYPGFVRDPYKEYSEPWFGDRKVLRRRLLGHPLPSDTQHVAELLHTGAAGRPGGFPHVCDRVRRK